MGVSGISARLMRWGFLVGWDILLRMDNRTESEKPGNSPKCSFCGKAASDKTGPMCESPDVTGAYLCYSCATFCVEVFKAESKRRGIPLPEV